MNDVSSEPVKAKRGRKPKNASLSVPTQASASEGPITKKAGRPAGTKNRKSKTSGAPVAKKVVQVPNAEASPKAGGKSSPAASAKPHTTVRHRAAQAQTASRPVAASSVSAMNASVAKEQDASVSLWKKMGVGIKVIIVLVVIGIIASVIKHF